MKMFLFAAAIAASAVSAAQAQDTAPTAPPKCLRTIDIQNTTTPNDKTILFHMNNGKVWRNDLRGACSGLTFNGFRYDVTPPNEIRCASTQAANAAPNASTPRGQGDSRAAATVVVAEGER